MLEVFYSQIRIVKFSFILIFDFILLGHSLGLN